MGSKVFPFNNCTPLKSLPPVHTSGEQRTQFVIKVVWRKIHTEPYEVRVLMICIHLALLLSLFSSPGC